MVVEADPENSQEDAAYQPRLGTRVVGVGPLPQPWPDDPRLDPVLLSEGDHRNVIDKYRYWSVEAIKADLTATQSLLHIAIENLEHDLNIGSIVRSGNAFNVGGVHIVGRRRWNKRGALVTDRYIEIYYHSTAQELAEWAREHSYRLVAIDNPPHSTRLEETQLPERCLLVFGQESTGISQELQDVCQDAVRIEQYGSTRSMNVAAAAAIAMHWWVSQHRRPHSQGGDRLRRKVRRSYRWRGCIGTDSGDRGMPGGGLQRTGFRRGRFSAEAGRNRRLRFELR